MKHKLTYSLLLSLVVLLSFDLALAQNVTVVGPTTNLSPNTNYNYNVVLDNGTGITAFTLPVTVSGAGYVSGSVSVTLGAATAFTIVGNQVLLGYTGPDLGPGPLVLATLTVTTANACGEAFTFETGSMPPAGAKQFAGGFGCAVASTFTGLTATLYNGIPVCGQNDNVSLVCGGSIVNKQINATEPIGLALTYTLINGPGTVGNLTGLYNYTPPGTSCDFSALVEVKVTNPCGHADTCSFTITYTQAAPVLTVPANQSYHWALGPQNLTASATDDACPTPHNLVYSMVVAPAMASISINAGTGAIVVDPACSDIVTSPHAVTVTVTDGCKQDQKSFTITVTNTAPVIACPANIDPWLPGDPIHTAFTASDANGDPIAVTVLSTTKNGNTATPSTPMTISGSYFFNWTPAVADLGNWEVTLQVDDGCMQQTCSFTVHVFKFHFCMDSTSVLSGHNAAIHLNFNDYLAIGGLDLLISYDLGGIRFLFATPLGELAQWEYFTYRYSSFNNCGSGCPSGLIHLIGIANMPNGVNPPSHIYHPVGNIVEMTFSTPQDLSFIGQCFRISWRTFDCGDNTLSSVTGDTLFVGVGVSQDCLENLLHKGVTPKPVINFCDGIICIIPPPDDRGDINLNGVPNEIADAVLFSNYFIFGPTVLHDPTPPDYFDNRVLATDINDDGTPLTIADLVYLIRVITGDAQPYPESGEGGKVAPYATIADVGYTLGEKMVVTAHSMSNVGGAAFIFRHTGEVGAPVLSDELSNMTLRSSDRDGELRVLVFSMNHSTITSGAHELFTVPMGEGAMELTEVQFSDAQGNLMSVNLAKTYVPTVYELSQNYPNPFNASTVIRFALPKASDWTLRIYNVAGQMVDEFKGHSEIGVQSLNWNANTASGIYFYKLVAGSFTDTKKMILMK